MPKNQQWSVTFDAYHRFVVSRFEGVFGTSRSEVIETMVRAWVSDHADQVTQAGASIRDWRKRKRKEGP